MSLGGFEMVDDIKRRSLGSTVSNRANVDLALDGTLEGGAPGRR